MAVPFVELRVESSIPAYRQICDAMRRHLVEGTLVPGQRLPPVRQLAVDLGVNFNTVAEAYRLLADEGWLELRRGRGAVVLDRRRPRQPDQPRIASLLERVGQLAAELQSAGATRSQIQKAVRSFLPRGAR